MKHREDETSARDPSRRRLLAGGWRVVVGGALGAIPWLDAAAASNEALAGTVVALAFDPRTGTLLEASAEGLRRRRPADGASTSIALPPMPSPRQMNSVAVAAGGKGVLYVAGSGMGVLRSEDGGAGWSRRNAGLPNADVMALATHADRPATVYAVLKDGLYRSEDDGVHWRLMDAGPRGGITRLIHTDMPGSMQSGWFFVAGPVGVRRSMDCFCGWRDAGGLSRPIAAVAYDPRRPSVVYAATSSALLVSNDGGEAWSEIEAPAGIQALVAAPDGRLYAAAADGRVLQRRAEGSRWQPLDG